MMWVNGQYHCLMVKLWQLISDWLSLCLCWSEASGYGHKADEDVCLRRVEGIKTGASAAQLAWVLQQFTVYQRLRKTFEVITIINIIIINSQTSVPVSQSWRKKQSRISRRCWRPSIVRMQSHILLFSFVFSLKYVFFSFSFAWGLWNPWMYFFHRGAYYQTGSIAWLLSILWTYNRLLLSNILIAQTKITQLFLNSFPW